MSLSNEQIEILRNTKTDSEFVEAAKNMGIKTADDPEVKAFFDKVKAEMLANN